MTAGRSSPWSSSRGMPLDEYARSRGLDAAARLELLAKVCDAVQHAHDKGVIHRDLKPGNILVDESGQPKVLDFGVAHVTAADLLSTAGRTQAGQLLGTLNYMSPEQIAADPAGLDGRSDVYTLGVILFELLAHRLPYHLDQLPGHEVARVIQEQEPSRLGSIDTHYRGDVEIIVAKALEKDKSRRYASAGDLASDIRRYLRGEAILARPASALYQLRKFARRHRALVAGSVGHLHGAAGGNGRFDPFCLACRRECSRGDRARACRHFRELPCPDRGGGCVRFRITTLPKPAASWARHRRLYATGNGDTCTRGSTTASPCSRPSPANLSS